MQLDPYDRQAWVVTLVANCPRHHPLPDCPALETRKRPIMERIAVAKQMPSREMDALISHHVRCLAARDRKHVTA